MRRLWIAFLVAVLCAAPAAASESSDSLLKFDRALATRCRAIGFVAAYSKAMAPDARKLDNGSMAAIGHRAVLALMARYPRDITFDRTPQEAVVARSGAFGFTWGKYIVTFHNKKGELVKQQGKYLDVWRRQRDGTWRWIADTLG
jgi:ketosteroid isomerase-like protein